MFAKTGWKPHKLTQFTFASYEHRIIDKTVKIKLTTTPPPAPKSKKKMNRKNDKHTMFKFGEH